MDERAYDEVFIYQMKRNHDHIFTDHVLYFSNDQKAANVLLRTGEGQVLVSVLLLSPPLRRYDPSEEIHDTHHQYIRLSHSLRGLIGEYDDESYAATGLDADPP